MNVLFYSLEHGVFSQRKALCEQGTFQIYAIWQNSNLVLDDQLQLVLTPRGTRGAHFHCARRVDPPDHLQTPASPMRMSQHVSHAYGLGT
jgi:hypothetical protein